MKIGLVCPYNIFIGGGVQEVVLAQAAGLRKLGHKVKIITPLPLDRREHIDDEEDLILVGGSASFKTPLHTTAQISASVDVDSLDMMLEAEQFDIIHFHEPWVPMLSRQILTRSEAVNVATFHAKTPETVMSKTLEKVVTPYTKTILKYLHELTAVSDAATEYARSLTDKHIEIIPNGIDLHAYKPLKTLKKPAKRKKILYIGRLEKRKGVKNLLEAFHDLSARRTDVELIIAGAGPDMAKLQSFVEDYQIPRVTFKGYITDKQKRTLLEEADLFCSPALYGESFGIVLLEAMAMGAVTVAGDNPGYSSVMKGQGAWSLVNPRDTPSFSRRLELMLFDDDMRKIWLEWARNYVKQFDYDKVVAQYEAFYKKAYKKHHP